MSGSTAKAGETDLANGKIMIAREGHIARITFDNPERMNAMSLDMWGGLHAALDQLASDPMVRVLVLNGAGEKAFVSGADISEFETQRSSADAVRHYNSVSEGADAALFDFPKPTIAEIQGYCIGGGMGLALACDFRICSAEARLGITAAKLGLGYSLQGVRKLIDATSPAVAARVLYSGDLFTANQAQAMGLVDEVVASHALVGAVNDLAERIAQNAPLTVQTAKAAIRCLTGSENAPQESDVARLVTKCFESEDYAEGRQAFSERRKPVFKGR